jgi:hypothetical protein
VPVKDPAADTAHGAASSLSQTMPAIDPERDYCELFGNSGMTWFGYQKAR